MSNANYGKALSWDELANYYDKASGGNRPARTRPMSQVFSWAEAQKNKFVVTADGTIHRLIGDRG